MRKIRYSVKAKKSKDGMLSIVISCEQFGKSIEIDTNVKVFSGEWDSCNASVLEENPNHIKLNKFIKRTLYELEEYELDFNSEFTLSKLKEVWECRESNKIRGIMPLHYARRIALYVNGIAIFVRFLITTQPSS